MDRSVLGILAQSIKLEFQLSDTQLGFLGGTSFAIFYTLMGIPLARLADSWVRRHLLLLSLLAWSGMTTVCGLAQTFWQLLLARIGVAVGEAGAMPASHSMISDLFAPNQRGTAISIFSLGIPLGTAAGLLVGGAINDLFGWRIAFMVVAIPGFLIAIIGHFTLKEPKRGAMDSDSRKPSPQRTQAWQTIRYLMITLRPYRYMAIAASLHNLSAYGVSIWMPAFLERTHQLSSTQTALWLSATTVTGMAIGTGLGGPVADYLHRRHGINQLWVPALATILLVPFACIAYLHDNYKIALLVMILPSILGASYIGPVFSTAQNMAPQHMRGMASSLLLFLAVIVGQGVGPQLIGALSDAFNNHLHLGADSLRWGMVAALAFNPLAFWFFIKAIACFREEIPSEPD